MEETKAIQLVKSEVQLKTWQDQVEAQKSSGLSVRIWCAENGINEKTFYYRMRKVRERLPGNQPAFVPLNTSINSSWEISLEKNGLNISLPSDISSETLLALVRELC